MPSIRIFRRLMILSWLLLVLVTACSQGKSGPPVPTRWLHEKNFGVRFVYDPPVDQANTVWPITFKQVEKQDPRCGTWSNVVPLGLTQWVSEEEMRDFVAGLQKLGLEWEVSPKPMVFRKELKEPPPSPPTLPWKVPASKHEGTMEIDITCDGGSAVAYLPSGKVCSAMKPLATAFESHNAKDNYWDSLGQWGCEVPDFRYYRFEPPEQRGKVRINE